MLIYTMFTVFSKSTPFNSTVPSLPPVTKDIFLLVPVSNVKCPLREEILTLLSGERKLLFNIKIKCDFLTGSEIDYYSS